MTATCGSTTLTKREMRQPPGESGDTTHRLERVLSSLPDCQPARPEVFFPPDAWQVDHCNPYHPHAGQTMLLQSPPRGKWLAKLQPRSCSGTGAAALSETTYQRGAKLLSSLPPLAQVASRDCHSSAYNRPGAQTGLPRQPCPWHPPRTPPTVPPEPPSAVLGSAGWKHVARPTGTWGGASAALRCTLGADRRVEFPNWHQGPGNHFDRDLTWMQDLLALAVPQLESRTWNKS